MRNVPDKRWTPYLDRYAAGEWRATIFRDMILEDALGLRRSNGRIVALDIGCGGGFDDDQAIQSQIADAADEFIGVEPDREMAVNERFKTVYRSSLEDSRIEPNSIDLAFAVMVLEHVSDPEKFWSKIHDILRPGGVFWGFTVDARNWFVFASRLTERLGVKDLYLNSLHGKKGEERYENYGVFYRTNSPSQVTEHARKFSSVSVLNLARIGQLDFYLPTWAQWIGRSFDRMAISAGWPGATLAVRVEK